MGGNSSLTSVKLIVTLKFLVVTFKEQKWHHENGVKAWSLYSSYWPPGQNLPKYNKYVYLVFGDWVHFWLLVHFCLQSILVFLSIFETPSIDGVTKVSHNVVIFLLIQITLSSFYLVTNYYFVEKNLFGGFGIWFSLKRHVVATITSYFTGNNFISLLSSIYISNIMCPVVIFKTEVITKIPTWQIITWHLYKTWGFMQQRRYLFDVNL